MPERRAAFVVRVCVTANPPGGLHAMHPSHEATLAGDAGGFSDRAHILDYGISCGTRFQHAKLSERLMKQIIGLVVVIAVLAAGWYFVSPLFIDEAVDEGFDFVLPDGRLDMDSVRAMSQEDLAAERTGIMAAAAGAPATTAAEGMPAGAPTVVKSGAFRDADAVHRGSGTATLYALPSGEHVLRLENLDVTNGPALVVYLAQHPSPQSADDVTDRGFVNLGELKGNVGNQNYPIPGDVDIEGYDSAVIWCELFGVLFSPAALTAP